MLKTLAAIFVGKSIFFLSRLFGLGGGFAAPGLYALKIDPNLVSHLINKSATNIIITGTNGKTTTSKLISHFFQNLNSKVIHNGSGSNLERGIASYLIKHANIFGQVNYDFGVWEVDEFAFNSVAQKIKPNVIILLNAFRDQLDRYGEVDNVIKRWRETLGKMQKETVLIINHDDGNLNKASADFKGKIITFGVNGQKINSESKIKVRKSADFEAKIINQNLALHLSGVKLNNLENTAFTVSFNGSSDNFELPLPGVFNVYNFLASFTLAYQLNLDTQKIHKSLENFTPAFGRFEQIRINSTIAYFFLVKNPVGASQVLGTILPHITPADSLLIALNDNFADGKDISWIWDISLEKFKMQNVKCKIFVSGIRAYDLALRLKYTGMDESKLEIIEDINSAFEKSLAQTQGKLFILPTYTALLQLQKIMVKKGIKKEYWKE